MTTPSVSHTAVKYGRVDQSKLTIDPRVQRLEGVNEFRCRKMADNFNPDSLGTFTVSARPDGTMVVLDGAHRRRAAELAGYTKPFHALIYTGLSIAEEAALFHQLNTFQQPSLISRMHAQVLAGDEVAGNVFGIIQSAGWRISQSSSDGDFAAVGAAQRIYETAANTRPKGDYPDVLRKTIDTVTRAWDHDRDGVHQMILLGVGQIFGRFDEHVTVESLGKAISNERPVAIRSHAKNLHLTQGGSAPAAAAKVMVGLYNKRRRTNLLPEWVWTR